MVDQIVSDSSSLTDRAREAILKVGWPKNVLSRETARNIVWALLAGGKF